MTDTREPISVRSLLVPGWAVLSAGLVNIIMFSTTQADVTSPGGQIRWGALHRQLLHAGDAWRTLACTFLHANTEHLARNLVFIYVFGSITERLLGPWRTLGIYWAAAVVGSCATVWTYPNAIAKGASGVVYGFTAAALIASIYAFRSGMLKWKHWYVLGYAMFAVLEADQVAAGLGQKGTSAAGHFGGAAAGAATALLFVLSMASRFAPAARTIRTGVALIWLASAMAVSYGEFRGWAGLAARLRRMTTENVTVEQDDAVATVAVTYPSVWANDTKRIDLVDRSDPVFGLGRLTITITCRSRMSRDIRKLTPGDARALALALYGDRETANDGDVVILPTEDSWFHGVVATRLSEIGLVTISFGGPKSAEHAYRPILDSILNGTHLLSCTPEGRSHR